MSSNQNDLIHKSDLKPSLLKRKSNAHKGSHGCVAILGGDAGMLGALVLASRSALFCGAGRVYAFALAKDKISFDFNHPEVMYKPIDEFQSMIETMDAIVIGPGFGQSMLAEKCLSLCLASNKPLVVDADALNLIAQHQYLAKMLTDRKDDTVLTPHLGEASRLLKLPVSEIENNRVVAAKSLASTFNCIAVLKGPQSICVNKQGDYWINSTGNPGLASAGTGDVLSGLIGGMIAQGMPCIEALNLAVYVHGQAADNLVANGIGPIGLTASEIVLEARSILNKWVG